MDKNKRDHATELNDDMLDTVAGGTAVFGENPEDSKMKIFCSDCNKTIALNSQTAQPCCSECGGYNIFLSPVNMPRT